MADTLEELLAHWLPRQRWYPRKGDSGAADQLVIESELQLPSADPAVRFRVLFVRVGPADSSLLLQIPLSLHSPEQREGAGVLKIKRRIRLDS
ncbi:hypothetical protein NHF46_25065 [Arthrobacter alpinus]|nr:hypothetical protein [Arthrobacter alpinus]